MQVFGAGTATYILLSGIKPSASVRLSENIVLEAADCSHLDLAAALAACSHPHDIPVVTAFIPRIAAQLRITASTPKELAIHAWNASWDALLLSACFRTEVGFNLQSDTTASEIGSDSVLRATNHRMNGWTSSPTHLLSDADVKWLESHYSKARLLINNERFQTAAHCLATFRWHSMPRIRLAVLWAGIEGVFGASSEIRFRVSLYIARYLQPDDEIARRRLFNEVKKLYDVRSAAVHGATLKANVNDAVEQSVTILTSVLRRCVELEALPDESQLVP